MNSLQFRALLLIAVGLGVVNAIVSSATLGTLPAELALYRARVDEMPLTGPVAVLSITLMILLIAATIGLYQYRSWSRPVAIIITVITFAVPFVSGPTVESAWAEVLYDLAGYAWGALLALSYWSPIAARFQPRQPVR